MNIVSVILVLIICFLAGMESVLDQWQFHQPIIACTLIGLVTGHPYEGIMLGGALQMVALGWMNIGAAVAPDAAFASTASAILVCMKDVDPDVGIAAAMGLAVAGLALTVFVRTLTVAIVHTADKKAEQGDIAGVERTHILAVCLQGLRVMIPAAAIIAVPVEAVTSAIESIPVWLTGGLAAAGGFIVVVGYAMVINMMATKELWPFFFLGFALASVSQLGLIAMGIIGVVLALIYLQLSPEFNGGAQQAAGGGDPLDAILNDYE